MGTRKGGFMNKINLAEIKKLLGSDPRSPAITIYLPTHRTASPPHMHEDQVRFKNLRTKALDILNARDKHNEFNQEFDAACEKLQQNQEFWAHMSESMLLCARPGLFFYYHLPIDSEEYVSVADSLHLAPVIGLVNDLRDYYVLGLSQQNPVLFKADAYGLAPSGIELPESIESALNIDEMHIKSVQFASISRGGGKGAQFHGHGAGKDTGDEERLRYFRILDGIICKRGDTSLPLILAGTDSEVAEYRSCSRHPQLLNRHIDGHFTVKDASALHEKSMEIIQKELVAASHKQALAEYEQLYGSLTADQMSELKDAAEKGRVKTLLVAMSRETRDTVRDTMAQVRKLVFPDDKVSQAVDYIAQQVVRQSGNIVNLTQAEMPRGKLILAINRY